MSMQLVEIQPHELKFIFEVKKQCSCAIHLANLSDQYVAFKVKTTSPKRYCVQPNISIIKPKSTCDITVTMQAHRSAPPDMQCKDKFLIQSTVVPFGTTEEDITPAMFMKDTAKYIEERKLRVVLISPPHSPVLLPVNGGPKQDLSNEASTRKEQSLTGVEKLPPPYMVTKKFEDVKTLPNLVEPRPLKVENAELIPAKKAELSCDKDMQSMPEKNVEGDNLKLSEDMKELNSKLRALDTKLIKAERIIAMLKEEKSTMNQEKETLKQELAMLRSKEGVRRVQVGFPPLFVCAVALIGLTIGLYLPAHS